MKKTFAGIMLALACMFAMIGVTAPAQAKSESITTAIPADANGYKFWSPDLCLEAGAGIPDDPAAQTLYRPAYMAQQWNLRTTILTLNWESDCAAAGYPPSRRMVIGLYNNPSDNRCTLPTNTAYNTLNGYKRWTSGPGMYLNTAYSGCVGSQARRDHETAAMIGYLLGLSFLASSAYDSRVMNSTTFSRENVTVPDQYSGNRLSEIYAYAYCQPFGTVC